MIKLRTIELLTKCSYKLGGISIYDQGIDCFGLVLEYLRIEKNIIIKPYHNNVNYRIYSSLYNRYQYEVMTSFGDFLSNVLLEIPVEKSFIGDIIICSDSIGYSAMIMVGNGNVLAAVENIGVGFVSINSYIKKRAFRWDQVKVAY